MTRRRLAAALLLAALVVGLVWALRQPNDRTGCEPWIDQPPYVEGCAGHLGTGRLHR
jgi:hypothetical protein